MKGYVSHIIFYCFQVHPVFWSLWKISWQLKKKLFAVAFVLEVEVSGFFVRSVCFSKRCHLLCMCILLCDLRVL